MIGGWNNGGSAVLCNSAGKWDRKNTRKILNKKKYTKLKVSFKNGRLKVGVKGKKPFINRKLKCLKDVKNIGVATGYGGSADWKFCGYGKS